MLPYYPFLTMWSWLPRKSQTHGCSQHSSCSYTVPPLLLIASTDCRYWLSAVTELSTVLLTASTDCRYNSPHRHKITLQPLRLVVANMIRTGDFRKKADMHRNRATPWQRVWQSRTSFMNTVAAWNKSISWYNKELCSILLTMLLKQRLCDERWRIEASSWSKSLQVFHVGMGFTTLHHHCKEDMWLTCNHRKSTGGRGSYMVKYFTHFIRDPT